MDGRRGASAAADSAVDRGRSGDCGLGRRCWFGHASTGCKQLITSDAIEVR